MQEVIAVAEIPQTTMFDFSAESIYYVREELPSYSYREPEEWEKKSKAAFRSNLLDFLSALVKGEEGGHVDIFTSLQERWFRQNNPILDALTLVQKTFKRIYRKEDKGKIEITIAGQEEDDPDRFLFEADYHSGSVTLGEILFLEEKALREIYLKRLNRLKKEALELAEALCGDNGNEALRQVAYLTTTAWILMLMEYYKRTVNNPLLRYVQGRG